MTLNQLLSQVTTWVVIGGVGVAGWFVYKNLTAPPPAPPPPPVPPPPPFPIIVPLPLNAALNDRVAALERAQVNMQAQLEWGVAAITALAQRGGNTGLINF